MPSSPEHPLCAKLGLHGLEWDMTMRRLFPSKSNGKEKKRCFHYFTRLPKEIQVAIWDLVVEETKNKRPFVVAVDTNRTLLSRSFHSPLLEVCVASRQVYRTHFPCALSVMHSNVLAVTSDDSEVSEACHFSPCALGGLVYISLQTDLLIDLSAWWRFQDWEDPDHVATYGQLVNAIRPHQFAFKPGFHRLKTFFAEYRTARSVGYQKADQVQYLLFDMTHMPARKFMDRHPHQVNRSSIFSVQLIAKRK